MTGGIADATARLSIALADRCGDLAVEWGASTIMVQRASGPPTIIHFKFVTVWERRGGVWRVRLNSWNADPPPASREH
jgi:ketosteroid isomerase-like protein